MPRLFASEILRAPQDSPGNPTGPTLPGGFISQNQSAISTHAGERAAGTFRTFTTALRARLELTITQAHEGGIERAHIGDSQTNSTTSSQPGTTSPTGEPSFTDTLRSTLANPPQNHNFEPSHETRPRIIEIARANGIEIVTPAGRSQSDGIPDPLRAHTRRIRETYGVETIYYRGGPGGQLGFSPRGNPDLIFINVDPSRSDIPLSWTTSHELLHVAQKDPHAGATEFEEKITSLLTPAELQEAHATLASFGYAEFEFATELPSFLVGDAISGKSVFGLDAMERGAEIRQAAEEYFNGLTKLTPTSLPASPDSELADTGTESAVFRDESSLSKNSPSLGIPPLENKPPNSPDPVKWLERGGTIDDHWTYTDWEGNKVSYPDGYPDFTKDNHVKAQVEIEQKGNYTSDFRDADAALGSKKPDGTTWHHHQNGTTMQAVSTRIHRRFTHRGGVSVKTSGVKKHEIYK